MPEQSVPAPRAADPLEVAVAVPGQRLALVGRLGVASAADVRLALADELGTGTGDLEVDASALVGLDATGLGVLVGAHRTAGRLGRRLVLHDVTPQVARLLRLSRLDRVLRTAGAAPAASARA